MTTTVSTTVMDRLHSNTVALPIVLPFGMHQHRNTSRSVVPMAFLITISILDPYCDNQMEGDQARGRAVECAGGIKSHTGFKFPNTGHFFLFPTNHASGWGY
jgi:hypothetical protein